MRKAILSGVVTVVLLGLMAASGPAQGPGRAGEVLRNDPFGPLVEMRRIGPKVVYHRYVPDPEGTQLFRCNAGSAIEAQLTRGEEPAAEPRWSPDAREIAYTWGRATHRIHVISAIGSGDREISTGAVHATQPAWSPGGGSFAFAGLSGTQWDIWTMTTTGGALTNLTNSVLADYHPDWSPDDRSIVYDHYEGPGTGYEVYTMASDGSGQRRLTENTVYDGMPRWSRDGTKVVFCREIPVPRLTPGPPTKLRPMLEIFVMSATGKNPTRLTERDGDDYCPCWSEDGSQILWLHGDRSGTEELWIMNADGSDQRRLMDTCGTSVDCWGTPHAPPATLQLGPLQRPPQRPGG